MAILKCKMCGGDIELSADKTFGTCDSCGSLMTFPKVDDEQRANMFNRGNHFRRAGEFDKALAVYERIVQEDENDAEAHWCCALCRFGIEYVEDPNTFEYLPTCHRASFDSFLEDVDYLAALEHSDGITRRQYQKDAAKIAEVQRGILATSQNEEPFDVFICYKESENDGTRTRDSLMAQEIYYQLTEQGRRVFFSRITLEDKAGTEYEPYIFAALNSAKVMIVVTTSAEHVSAVWVKNEWSRFLSLMRKDRTKLLLPCYRDMDPYDLPEALSVLQSYDMGKIGFIQDLTRGVNKVLDAAAPKTRETVKETVIVQQSQTNGNTSTLLDRAFLALEDGEWEKADAFFEQVLNLDARNAEAYLGKLMAELHVRTRDALKDQPEPFNDRNNYKKAYRFGDEKLKAKLSGDIAFIKERNETARLTGIYNTAIKAMNAASTEFAYKSVAATFKTIRGFKNADSLAEQCLEKAEEQRKLAEQRIEQAKRQAPAVMRALKEGVKPKSGPTLEDQFAAAKTRVEYLERFLSVFHATQSNILALQSNFNSLVTREKQLVDQRSRLGIFAGKKKKRIDEELAAVSTRKSDLAARIDQNQKTLGNYASAADVERDLSEARNKANDIEMQIESARENASHEYSFEEALNIYLRDSDVTHAVNNVLYPTISRDSIVFGRYVQKKNGSPEPIEWQVLARENGRMLVISKYALDCRQYNSAWKDVEWETCSLRKWLNGTFLNAAFNSSEQNSIVSSTVTADKKQSYSMIPGNNATDKVFLLSIAEVNKYFSSDEARKCVPTNYAIAQGVWTSDSDKTGGRGTCFWWLRSPGYDSLSAAGVYRGGSVNESGIYVRSGDGAVRPAMWIDIG